MKSKTEDEKRTYETGNYYSLGNGKYRLRVSASKGVGGKRLRPSKTVEAKNDREAERLLKDFIIEIESQNNVERMTVAGLITRYQDEHVSGLSVRTQRWYADTLRRVNGGLGHFLLNDLKPMHINKFYRQLADPDVRSFCKDPKTGKELPNGLSNETILHHHRALSAVLNFGYDNDLTRARVIDKVKPPSSDTEEKRALSYDEILSFGRELTNWSLRWQVYMILNTLTGLRREEINALEWPQIDTAKNKIKVIQAMHDPGTGRNVLGKVKNESSRRTIDVHPQIIKLLLLWKVEQAKQRMAYPVAWKREFVFTTEAGQPINLSESSKTAAKMFKYAGIKDASLHTLRHTSVTRQLACGTPVNDVAAYHGHASAKMTLDTYGHASGVYDREHATIEDGISALVVQSGIGPKLGLKVVNNLQTADPKTKETP